MNIARPVPPAPLIESLYSILSPAPDLGSWVQRIILADDGALHNPDHMEVCQAIAASGIQFDQLIFEQARSTWVHCGIGDKMRRQVLSWRSGKGYQNGIVKI